MSHVNVRITGTAQEALAALTADGTTVSEAVRRALLDSLQLRQREQMRTEALRALADPDDRAAVRQVFEEWADVGQG